MLVRLSDVVELGMDGEPFGLRHVAETPRCFVLSSKDIFVPRIPVNEKKFSARPDCRILRQKRGSSSKSS